MGRHRAGAPLPRLSVRSESHPLRANKQAPQQSPCRPFRYKEDSRADSQKVLLADTTTKRWGLRQGLQHLFGFKGSLLQALQRSSIIAHSNLLVERSVNRLCYRPPNLSRSERWQLRLDIGYCWLAYKNSILWANQSHDQCIRSSRSDHQCGCALPRSSGVNCYGLRLAFHIQILVLVVLLPRDQKKAIYSLPPSNKWLDREAKQYDGGVPQSICQLGAR